MKVAYLPVLAILRDLYQQPRDMQRFRNYVATLTGGGDDIVLPIVSANPMAKKHALAKLDELLALGAEEIGADAARQAEARLTKVESVEIKASVLLADDVGGGWTNRYTSEAQVRFPGRGALKRPFATALVWTSESQNPEQIGREVLAAIYRVAYQQRFGLPLTLATMLEQEGFAAVFAGEHGEFAAPEVDRWQTIIHALGDDPPYPRTFAALYGDVAAEELGHQPLGLPPRAGFNVALADALHSRRDPVEVIGSRP